jgi:DnaJ-class molecular chaperone
MAERGEHRYAVMREDGREMGDFVGYFCNDLNEARSIADEHMVFDHDEGEDAHYIIYSLVKAEGVYRPFKQMADCGACDGTGRTECSCDSYMSYAHSRCDARTCRNCDGAGEVEVEPC